MKVHTLAPHESQVSGYRRRFRPLRYSIYDHETSYIAASESMMHPIDFG